MEKEKLVIDGTNAILGRMASYVAKQALQGKEVAIVNCEKAIILGNTTAILRKFIWKKRLGSYAQKGPYTSKLPEKIVKRAIRGMLPYKKGKGAEAFDRIKCYKGVPAEFSSVKKIVAGKEKNRNFVTVEKVAGMF